LEILEIKVKVVADVYIAIGSAWVGHGYYLTVNCGQKSDGNDCHHYIHQTV
jgi:hypothetical protein